jgi:hypothetical protein
MLAIANTCSLGGIAPLLVDDPSGKNALGLLRCSKWGQLSNSHGLDARTNEAPAWVFTLEYPRASLRGLPGITFRYLEILFIAAI